MKKQISKKCKQFIASFLVVAIMFAALPLSVFATSNAAGNTTEFAGGTGTAEDPYLVKTKYHLNNVGNYPDAHFKMIEDIEFSKTDFEEKGDFYNNGKGWEAIEGFSGTFDGNGFAISNLYASGSDRGGLFGPILLSADYPTKSVCFKNIALINCDISAQSYAGGIVSNVRTYDYRYVLFENCFVSGVVTATNGSAGGICGRFYYYNSDNYDDSTAFSQCYNSANVTGKEGVGGIVGSIETNKCYADVILTNCCNTGDIIGIDCVGGVVGSSVGYSSSTSNVWVSGTYVYNSYNTGDITATQKYAGGIVGYKNSGSLRIPQTYSVGSFVGNGSGLVGGFKHSSTSSYYEDGYFLYDGSETIGDTFGYAKTTAAMKRKATYSGWDFDTVWTMGGDPDYPYPELQCFTLSGNLGIKGEIAYPSTVEADLSGVDRNNGVFAYEWLIDGECVGTDKTYTFIRKDIGKKVKLKVSGSSEFNRGTLFSEEFVIADAIGEGDLTVPVPNLVSSGFDSLTLNWDEYLNATTYYINVSCPEIGYKKTFNTTDTQCTIKGLASDTEYIVRIKVGYDRETAWTANGSAAYFKTAKDDQARLTLANNPDGQSIDVTIVNFVEGETYCIYRVTESGNKLLEVTETETCTVKAIVGDNILYAKALAADQNTAKVKIRLYKADVKLALSAKAGNGYAILNVSSIVEVKNYYYYRIDANGNKKLVKASNSGEYIADAFRGANSYYVKADVVYPDGTEGVISSNTITVDIETPAMTLTCTKEDNKVKINVSSDFEVTDIWIYRIKADGKSQLLVATKKATTYLPASWGTTYKVKVCVYINGNEMFLGSDNVAAI